MLSVYSILIGVVVIDVAGSAQVSAAGGLLLYIIKLSLTLWAIPSTAEYQHHLWELLPIKAGLQYKQYKRFAGSLSDFIRYEPKLLLTRWGK